MQSWDVLEEAASRPARASRSAGHGGLRQGPSSGQQGSARSLRRPVTCTVDRWGGAEPVVIREAGQVITEGVPRLLLLGTPEQFASKAAVAGRCGRDDVCADRLPERGRTGGYIEPMLLAPHLVVGGRSPMVLTVADLFRALGWRTTVLDAGVSRPTRPRARWWSWRPRATGTRTPSSRPSRPTAATRAIGSAKRGAAVLGDLATGACRRTSRPGPGARGPGPGPDVASRDRGGDPGRMSSSARRGRSASPRQWCGGRVPARAGAPKACPRRAGNAGVRGSAPGLQRSGLRTTVAVDPSSYPLQHEGVTMTSAAPGAAGTFQENLVAYLKGSRCLIKNDFEVAQPVEKVWQLLGNIPQVATCLPGRS